MALLRADSANDRASQFCFFLLPEQRQQTRQVADPCFFKPTRRRPRATARASQPTAPLGSTSRRQFARSRREAAGGSRGRGGIGVERILHASHSNTRCAPSRRQSPQARVRAAPSRRPAVEGSGRCVQEPAPLEWRRSRVGRACVWRAPAMGPPRGRGTSYVATSTVD